MDLFLLNYRHEHFASVSLICLLLFSTVIDIYLNLDVYLHCKLGLHFSILRTLQVLFIVLPTFFVSVSSGKYSMSTHICFIIKNLEQK